MSNFSFPNPVRNLMLETLRQVFQEQDQQDSLERDIQSSTQDVLAADADVQAAETLLNQALESRVKAIERDSALRSRMEESRNATKKLIADFVSAATLAGMDRDKALSAFMSAAGIDGMSSGAPQPTLALAPEVSAPEVSALEASMVWTPALDLMADALARNAPAPQAAPEIAGPEIAVPPKRDPFFPGRPADAPPADAPHDDNIPGHVALTSAQELTPPASAVAAPAVGHEGALTPDRDAPAPATPAPATSVGNAPIEDTAVHQDMTHDALAETGAETGPAAPTWPKVDAGMDDLSDMIGAGHRRRLDLEAASRTEPAARTPGDGLAIFDSI